MAVGAGLASCVYFFGSLAGAEAAGEPVASNYLYPTPKAPLEEGYLQVSDLHQVYYHTYGNKNGKPVIFVHGGPGGGTSLDHARYFDPSKYYIILMDQRGAGKSKPFASLEDNTTWHSVADLEQLRKHLNVKKWLVFGGSWGSTLAISYAQIHPHCVTELVLRGIFCLRKKELDWFYEGKGANFIYPDYWQYYEEAIPVGERGNYIEAYGKRLRGEMGDEEMRKAAKAWSMWEGRTSNLVPKPAAADSRFGADDFSLAFARIENHYFTNKGFFPRDGYLLEEEQIAKIRHIPCIVVQGRYDVVCPFITAFDLKKVWGDSCEFITTITGHSGFEADISKELVKATDKFAEKR